MKNNHKIKTIAATALVSMMSFGPLSLAQVSAADASFTSTTKNTSKISVHDVDYDLDDSRDAIEIDFSSRIKLKKSAKVTVKDGSGKKYTSYISDSDSNELDLDVTNMKAGKKYTVTISGIKKSTASAYGTLTIKFSIPASSSKNLIKEIDSDLEDSEVTIDFRKNVTYSNPKVVITNKAGTKTYPTSIIELDRDELSVRVRGLTAGKTYKIKITGVKGANTLTSSFVAGYED